MSTNNVKHADPLKTKTGKTRLGPLNHKQLQDMLDKARPKDKEKIQNRISRLAKKVPIKVQEEEVAVS